MLVIETYYNDVLQNRSIYEGQNPQVKVAKSRPKKVGNGIYKHTEPSYSGIDIYHLTYISDDAIEYYRYD